MIEHVWHRCQEARAFGEVLVATDDARIRTRWSASAAGW